uniref:(northern house mosquito) hypothetical protein n=1 Tax=Culex pipiens TaxID=7175 RepID=A0A8D8AZL2_CULPI
MNLSIVTLTEIFRGSMESADPDPWLVVHHDADLFHVVDRLEDSDSVASCWGADLAAAPAKDLSIVTLTEICRGSMESVDPDPWLAVHHDADLFHMVDRLVDSDSVASCWGADLAAAPAKKYPLIATLTVSMESVDPDP